MIILGIDPGYATVGFGVISAVNDRVTALSWGAISTKPDEAFPERLVEIYNNTCQIISKFHPDCMAIEELFFNTNQKTVIHVGQARGVLLLAAANNGVKISEYTPLQVKSAVVGYGRAEKKQVMELIRLQLDLRTVPKPDDAADALALAICHARSCSSDLYKYIN